MSGLFTEVIVPDGLIAGDAFALDVDGFEYTVLVPAGVAGGDTMTVEVEVVVVQQQQQGEEEVEVLVPEGVGTGETFVVVHNGAEFEVALPDGAQPGRPLIVALPFGAPTVSPPLDVGRRGSHQKAPTPALPAPPAPASEPAPDAGGGSCSELQKHKIGSRVMVCRTNGSWSPAFIIAHDAINEWYTVKLDPSGALKHLVEESDLAEIEFKPKVLGEHFEGRRVQVHVGGIETGWKMSWEEAIIRDYDGDMDTYSIEMVTGGGGTKRGVRPRQIRVRTAV